MVENGIKGIGLINLHWAEKRDYLFESGKEQRCVYATKFGWRIDS